jgi:pimeloyl-ACP methyl ester carboxylesterase
LFFGKLRYDWVFDDYIAHDIPAAVATVRRLTGRPSIHWIGHSMGGMLAYPFLVSCDRELVRSCVTVGAPSVAVVKSDIHDLIRTQIRLVKYVPFIPWRYTGRALAPFVPLVRRVVESVLGDFLYNPENMDDETLSCLLRNAVENLPPSIVQQAGEFYDTKNYQSYYRTFSFRDNLHRIEVPLLVIAGSIDRLTPPDDLKYVFDHVSSQDKEFVVIGRAQGARTEYGHVDLILGKNAPEDVFPTIGAWLDRQDRAAHEGAEDGSAESEEPPIRT